MMFGFETGRNTSIRTRIETYPDRPYGTEATSPVEIVLMEVFRPVHYIGTNPHAPIDVSILVLMEVFRPDDVDTPSCNARFRVSILVLMEVFRPVKVRFAMSSALKFQSHFHQNKD